MVPFCNLAQEIAPTNDRVISEDSSKVKVKRLDINTAQSDFSPRLVNKELVFASGRPNTVAMSYTNDLKTEVSDLFYAGKRDSVRFSMVKPLSKSINSIFNEGPFSFNSDGTMIYYSGNIKSEKSKKATNKLQIYVSRKNGMDWSTPEVASFCNQEYSNFHPALSKDNNLIVFCSDMPGGFGGVDLYSCRFENGQWSKPLNLGASVNSPSNELFPYLSDNQILYFSSNRAGGPGGLDLYKVPLKSGMNNVPVLLEPPLNSAFDDFGICMDSTGGSGYFATNRIGKYSDDIYYFYSYPDFSEAKTPPEKTKFCYTFFEEKSEEEESSIISTYEWDFGDGKKERGETCRHCFEKPGNYSVQLNIVEKTSGEIFYNKVNYTLTVEEPPRIFINCPDNAGIDNVLSISAEQSKLKGYQLMNFYWSFGDGKYNQGAHVKHRYLKSGTYRIELGVIAKNEKTQKFERFKIEKNIIIKDTI